MLGEPEFSLQSMCKPENIYALACILREAVLKAFAETAVLCSSRLQLFMVYLLIIWNWKYVSWVATIIFSAGVVRGLARIGGSAQGLLSWLYAQGIFIVQQTRPLACRACASSSLSCLTSSWDQLCIDLSSKEEDIERGRSECGVCLQKKMLCEL